MRRLLVVAGLLLATLAPAQAHPLWPLEVGRLWAWEDGTISEIVSETAGTEGFTMFDERDPLGAGTWAEWSTDSSGNVYLRAAGLESITATVSPAPVWLPISASPGTNWSGNVNATVVGGIISPLNYTGTLAGTHEGLSDYASPWGLLQVARIHLTLSLNAPLVPSINVDAIIDYAVGIGPVRRSLDGGATWQAVVALGSGFTPVEPSSMSRIKAVFGR